MLASGGTSIYAFGSTASGASGAWTSSDGAHWLPVQMVGTAPAPVAPPVASAGDANGLVVIGPDAVWFASVTP